MFAALGRVSRRRLAALLAVVVTIAAPLLAGIQPAFAGVGVAAVPNFPSMTTVGAGPFNVSLTLTNGSDGVNFSNPITLSNIRLNPSCGAQQIPCSTPDPGVFSLSTTGIGAAGTACAGVTFAISAPDANGTVTFTPPAAVVLGPNDGSGGPEVCIINFTVLTVSKAPTLDARPDIPGRQTTAVATLDATDLITGEIGAGQGVQIITVALANVGFTTTASPAIVVGPGNTIRDTATLTGGSNPTGTITFQLFGPDDPTCAGANIQPPPAAVTVTGTGQYMSTPFTPTQPGTYRYRASYSGDANNNPFPLTACNEPGESVVVGPALAIITQVSAATTTVGTPVTDRATLTGGANPTGTLVFRAFGPNDVNCAAAPVFTSAPVTVAGAGDYTSTPAFTPTAPGLYRFTVTYSGDANNPALTTPCGAPNEDVTVNQAAPAIVTQVSTASTAVGTPVTDRATLSGGFNLTGTLVFRAFGPNDAACAAAPVFISAPVTVAGAGDYTSTPAFTPMAPGTYRFTVTYSGDANNVGLTTACNDPNENVVVGQAALTIVTQVSAATTTVGTPVTDRATLTGGFNPTGTLVFRAFGPNDATCAAAPAFTSAPVTVTGSGAYTSPAFTPLAPGTYRFTVTYSGDVNNAGLTTACNDPNENVVVNQSAPAIITQVSAATTTVGTSVTDRATLSGGFNPTGTLVFRAFGPNDATCAAAPVFTSAPVTVNGPGDYTSTPAFTPMAPGTYRFTVTYSGDANNVGLTTACNDPNENVVVNQASLAIVTQVSLASTTVGTPVTDRATLSGGFNPTGTLVFRAFGPNDATCAAAPVFTSSPVTVTGPGDYTSTPAFTPTAPGTYRFTVTYSGDANNAGLTTACNDPNENVVVNQAAPVLTTRASSGVNVGGTIRDVATLTGLVNPTAAGTVTFTVFGPNNATCTGPPVFTSTNPVDPATGTATSGSFPTTAPGIYRFVASYSGDVNNAPAGPTACNDPLEQVTVGLAGPSIVTLASPPVPVGGQIADLATLSGGMNPTGSITFTLFGPDNVTCAGTPTFTSTVAVNGNGNYPSGPYTVVAAGTYRWIAVYSGDANNAQAGPTACADPLELTAGLRVTPTLTTVASAGILGGQVFDTATLSGGFNPTGSITFQLFNNETCTGPALFTSVKPVNGNGNVTSDSFILPAPGIYHFVATYSGDANNNPVGPTDCLDPNETVGVGRLPISLSTVASPTVPVGGAIFDTATVAGGFNPTGTLTFTLFGPDNATCAGPAAFTSVITVNGNGSYNSTSFTPNAPGTYRWVASYSGDANNASAVTPCDDPLERVVVTPRPTISVDKTAMPESRPVPGGTFTFPVVVTNTSNVRITITSLTDDIYGDITTRPGSTCNTAIGTVLQPSPGPGHTYSCRFDGDFRGPSGASQTDVVTVRGVDERGITVRDDDDAIVRITPVPPTITTTKTAAPPSLPEPGGTFSFNYSVTNTGPEPVTVTSIVDDVYGDLNGRGTCAIGTRLPANGGTYRCSFSGNFFANAGGVQVDIITTTARDDGGRTVTSQARASVTITDVPPSIRIVKTADPTSRPEPGGSFRFTVTVTNTSFEPITTTSLVDDIYGDLNGRGSCAVGVRLAANGGGYSCAFDGEFRGRAGASQTDTVTVAAVDDDGTRVTALAKATVTLTPAPPVVPPPSPSPPAVVQPPPPPPPPPPTTVVQPPPPVVVQSPPRALVRTGSDLAGPARLAGVLLLVGMTLIAATWKFGGPGPAMAFLPGGPGGGPGPNGAGGGGVGGHRFGNDSRFGGARAHPPRGPLGTYGVGVAERTPAGAEPGTPSERAWDDRVRDAAPVAPDRESAFSEVSVISEAAAHPEVASFEVRVPEAAGPEVVVPRFVSVRVTAALDAAALDAANAGPVIRGPQRPPAGRRHSRRFGGR